MPPKKDGKKKLTKAEKEKLKREEAERKAEEEEQARIQAAIEEKERKKRERIEAIERKKLENEERKTRKVDMLELKEILDKNSSIIEAAEDTRRKNRIWERYMKCDGSPDPTIPGEINTYINLRLEDKCNDDDESVLKASNLDLSLINELQFLLDDSGEELTPNQRDRFQTTIEDLQYLLRTKLDAATFQVLLNATALQNTSTMNLQYTVKNDHICVCVWGNLSKNPRIKSFEFADAGFTFDIPKILSISDCAIRVLSTKYDHFSPHCKSFYPRQKKREVTPPPEEPVEEEKIVVEEEKKEVEEEDGEKEGEKEEDVMAALRELEKDENEEQPHEEEEEKKEEVEEEEDFEDPPVPEPPEWEEFEGYEDDLDLRANHVLGGVFHLDLMKLPPQPKTVKSWNITRLVNPPELQMMEYTADNANATPTSQREGQEKEKRDERPPITVTMKLPSDVVFFEEPLVARWNDKTKTWSTEGFSDMSCNDDTRVFTFKTSYFGTIALLQDAYANLPFQSWEIRPHATNKAVLTIIAAIVEIVIEIDNDKCSVTVPEDKPEMEHLKNKWMDPKDLITALQRTGINVFPAEDASKYVNIQEKNLLVEQRAYEQMALTSSTMAYSWSKWNGDTDKERVVFQASEALEDEPLLEEEWSVYTMTQRRASKLQMTEFVDEFSEELADETEFRSNMYHLLMLIGSEEAKTRINETSPEFINTVHHILKATKLLTYS